MFGCKKCDNNEQEMKTYIDKKTGLLCATIEEKYDKPKDSLILVPYLCNDCATINWKCIDTR